MKTNSIINTPSRWLLVLGLTLGGNSLLAQDAEATPPENKPAVTQPALDEVADEANWTDRQPIRQRQRDRIHQGEFDRPDRRGPGAGRAEGRGLGPNQGPRRFGGPARDMQQDEDRALEQNPRRFRGGDDRPNYDYDTPRGPGRGLQRFERGEGNRRFEGRGFDRGNQELRSRDGDSTFRRGPGPGYMRGEGRRLEGRQRMGQDRDAAICPNCGHPMRDGQGQGSGPRNEGRGMQRGRADRPMR